MKIYTKTGDQGKTSLFGGSRVNKDHIRIEAYGSVDELNSWIGVLRSHVETEDQEILIQIQNNLFNIGSILATEKETAYPIPMIDDEHISNLESWMDKNNDNLPDLKNFVLPGGHESVGFAHVCRTVCRRSERRVISLTESSEIPANLVIYLNRLSDFLFVLARKLTFSNRVEEVVWTK